MAYTNKVTEIVVGIIVVLFQAVAIESLPELTTPCALAIPEIVVHCYASTNMSSSPSEKCCNDLKTANKREVTCLCDNFIANPSKSNFPRTLYDQINTACGVADKFACSGT